MKNVILLELAKKWEKEGGPMPCPPPGFDNNVIKIKEELDIERGKRSCKRECAGLIRTLVNILGGDDA